MKEYYYNIVNYDVLHHRGVFLAISYIMSSCLSHFKYGYNETTTVIEIPKNTLSYFFLKLPHQYKSVHFKLSVEPII